MSVSLMQPNIRLTDWGPSKAEANEPAAVYPQPQSAMVGAGLRATPGPQLAQGPCARADRLRPQLGSVPIKLATRSPEFRCHRSAFPGVMDPHTRFVFCLQLLTAALGPLALGKSRRRVRGSDFDGSGWCGSAGLRARAELQRATKLKRENLHPIVAFASNGDRSSTLFFHGSKQPDDATLRVL